MPEAAVDEHGDPVPRKDNVGLDLDVIGANQEILAKAKPLLM